MFWLLQPTAFAHLENFFDLNNLHIKYTTVKNNTLQIIIDEK